MTYNDAPFPLRDPLVVKDGPSGAVTHPPSPGRFWACQAPEYEHDEPRPRFPVTLYNSGCRGCVVALVAAAIADALPLVISATRQAIEAQGHVPNSTAQWVAELCRDHELPMPDRARLQALEDLERLVAAQGVWS